MPILYFDSMGSVDFQSALNVSAIYADESELVTGGATGLTVLEKVKERVVVVEVILSFLRLPEVSPISPNSC